MIDDGRRTMTLGTAIVGLVLLVIVAAIIVSIVRSHRSGKHIGCEGCGGCSCNDLTSSSSQGCSCAEHMLEDVEKKLG